MYKIESMNIISSNICNLKCKYCFLEYYNYKNLYEFNEEDENFKKLIKSNIKMLVFTGNEPTLNPMLNKIVGKKKLNHNIVITNGIEKIQDISNIHEIIVSLDGDFEIMSFHRGVSNTQYSKIIENLIFYKENIKKCSINCVITKFNLEKVYKLIRNNFFYGLKINIIPVSLKCCCKDLCLDQNDLKRIVELNEIILKEFNYHLDITCDIYSKRDFMRKFSEKNPILFSPSYSFFSRKYYLFNREYENLKKLKRNYHGFSKKITVLLLDFLKSCDEDFLFDPYSLIENLLLK